MSDDSSRRALFLAGVRAELPILLGVVPFGLIYGITALAAGMSPAAAQAMSAIVFAGSAQFVIAQLVGLNAPAVVIVATTFVVNLRHVLYSASIAPHVRHLPARWQWLLAYLLTDEAYVVTISYYNRNPDAPHRAWYLLGAGLALWSSWQASTAFGVFLGATVPPDWPLDFALPLTFIALVVPVIRDRATVCAALAAGAVAVLAAGLPYKLGLIVAAFAGMVVGLLVEPQQEGARRRAARQGNI